MSNDGQSLIHKGFISYCLKNAGIGLINPFERGDFEQIVKKDVEGRNIDNYSVGIKATPHERKMTLDWPEERNYSDMYIMVYFADQKVGFVHDHLYPIFLEKYLPQSRGNHKERVDLYLIKT